MVVRQKNETFVGSLPALPKYNLLYLRKFYPVQIFTNLFRKKSAGFWRYKNFQALLQRKKTDLSNKHVAF